MDSRAVIGLGLLIAGVVYAARSYASTQDSVFIDTTGDTSGNWLTDLWGSNAPPDMTAQQPDTGAAIPDAVDYTDTGIPQLDLGETSVNWKTNDYPKYADFIANIERKYNIPTDLLARLLYQESRYRPDVIAGTNRSPVGALGIAQFMPATAAWLHVDPLEPLAAIDGAGMYLKRLYNDFSGNWQYALMAYNWGEGNVKHWINGDTNPKTGQPYTPPQETQNYFAQINSDVQVA